MILLFTSCAEGVNAGEGARVSLTEFAPGLLPCFEVQCEETPDLGFEFGIRTYPTICVIISGKVAERVEGWNKQKLLALIATGFGQEN